MPFYKKLMQPIERLRQQTFDGRVSALPTPVSLYFLYILRVIVNVTLIFFVL